MRISALYVYKSDHLVEVLARRLGVICVLAALFAFGSDQNWRTFRLSVLLIWQGSLFSPRRFTAF